MTKEIEDNILKVNVAEEIKMEDMGLGGDKPEDHMAKYREETLAYLKRYVPPHRKISRTVTEADIDRVIKDGEVMLILCSIPRGMYGNISAIAHPQIDDNDPLRFFVLSSGMIIINPIVVNHTKTPVFKSEGCCTYPEEPMNESVMRYHKIQVSHQTLIKDGKDGKIKLSEPKTVDLSGNVAQVFLHETDHLNAIYIYDEAQTKGEVGKKN